MIETYLPRQMDPEEVRQLVAQAVDSTGASSQRDMGRVMAAVLPQVQGRADGKLVSQLVRDALAAKAASG